MHVIDSTELSSWQTANKYHLTHSVALVAISWTHTLRGAALYGAYCLVAGITLFSGIIYLLCFLPQKSPLRKIGMLGPVGGSSYILGWLLLAYSKIPVKP